MFENYLIDCCAPTLASLKSGSLFCCRCSSETPIDEAVSEWNAGFSEYGVSMCILRRTESRALIYVYRSTSLARTLTDPEVQEFLESYGYESCSCCEECDSRDCSIASCIEHLRTRLACSDLDGEMRFPHEIGVFLGYPLQDVKGFIDNDGKNSKCTGLWKVYGDKEASLKLFEKYRKCFSVYKDLWSSGRRSIFQLTVAG